jgi:hypothetical protein
MVEVLPIVESAKHSEAKRGIFHLQGLDHKLLQKEVLLCSATLSHLLPIIYDNYSSFLQLTALWIAQTGAAWPKI